MTEPQAQPQQIPVEQILARVEMTVGEWNQVIAVLSKGVFEVVAPLISKIIAQGRAALPEASRPPANGPLPQPEAGHVSN
jgi:hypothetical protein